LGFTIPQDDVLRRLQALDRQSLAVDQERVQAALTRHFAALGLERPPIAWVRDAGQGQLRTSAPLRGAQAMAAWREAELNALKGIGRLIAYALWTDPVELDRRPSISPLRDALRDAAWSPLESRVLEESLRSDLRWFDIDPRWRHPRSAALCASLAAAWRPAMRKHIPVWEPFLDACEAGLWIFWVVEGGIVAVPRPVIRGLQGRLHAESGPAVEWFGGSGWYYWRGMRVPRLVIEEPGAITLASITDEDNLEIRRILIERYGHARFLSDLGAKPVASDDFGTLYRVEFADDEPMALVKVINSTPEPDGTRKEYFLRVPPTMRTAREAVAWTFGVPTLGYAPLTET
jgi:hypothetical protein